MKRILPGPNAVRTALSEDPGGLSVVYRTEGLRPGARRELEDLCAAGKVRMEVVERENLDAICGELNHQGVAAIGGYFPYRDLDQVVERARASKPSLIVVLDQVQDPGNLGAIVRSAHSLGAAGIVLTKDRSAAVTGAAVRASAGATECTAIARVTNLARALDTIKDRGLFVLGAAMDGDPIDTVDMSGPCALVFGNEANGLRRLTRERCDLLFSIPMAGGFESLNVSAAAAIALFVASRASIPKKR